MLYADLLSLHLVTFLMFFILVNMAVIPSDHAGMCMYAYPKWPLLKPWCVYDCAGIVKTHHLGFQECEALQAVFTKELCPNHIAGPAR